MPIKKFDDMFSYGQLIPDNVIQELINEKDI